MRKYILAIALCYAILITNAQDPDPSPPQKPVTEKAKTSPAIWIGVGVVFFCVFIAMNKKKMKKHKE